MHKSENLCNEISDKSTSIANAFVSFHNSSRIKVVTSNDGARSRQ